MQKIIYRILVVLAMFFGSMQGYQLQIPAGKTLDGIVTYVIDGDTVRVNGVKIRIWGIDAPEQDQRYYNDATSFMSQQALWAQVTCLVHDKDRHGRVVAQCTRKRDDADLGKLMVQAGWAKDYTRHSRRFYLPQQLKAQRSHNGIWQ